MKVTTDMNQINEFLTRGVEQILPSKEWVLEKLASGKRLRVYYGIDPTGPTLHIGHVIPIRKMAQLQQLGHEIIFLVGDFTAQIGDPTDKLATRVPLTPEQIASNLKNYQQQASRIIKFDGDNPAQFKMNSEWLGRMTFVDVLNLSAKVTVQQMLERDMFKKRLEEGKSIGVHEFMYPLMQGQDSVALMVDGEIGGNDQLFNMLMGRTLLKDHGKEKFVMTMKLLADPTGKKMGKSEGNMITLDDAADDMFGKVMAWTDAMIIPGFELCTSIPREEIVQMEIGIQNGESPMEFKKRLAREIVTLYHDRDAAISAQTNWENTFSKGGLPDEIPEVVVVPGELLVDILIKEQLVESKSDFRRLVDEGAVKILDHDGAELARVTDVKATVSETTIFKIGKRKFIKVRTS